MAENKQNTTPERRPDCVTEIRMGNTVHVVQLRYGIVGLAVGNGGFYVKTDQPTTNYRPLPKTFP